MDNNQKETNTNVLHNINAQNVGGLGRRRGHQHHIRHDGSRTSNIEADEVLAALRRGDQMPITETFQQYFEPSLHQDLDIDDNLDGESSIDSEKQQLFYNDNKIDSCTTTDQNTNRNLGSNKNHGDCIQSNLSTTIQMHGKILIADDNEDVTPPTNLELNKAFSSDTQITLPDGSNNPINSSKTDKSKTKRSKKGGANQLDIESDKETWRRKFRKSSPIEERPPLEGSDSDYWTENNSTDVENDPEAAEWLKLRCTSERTEVVAEREYRRQNRRCADYPGLAFGRSIFSSDTMMKLNIIRNELHNIMKTQLKRVRVMDVKAA